MQKTRINYLSSTNSAKRIFGIITIQSFQKNAYTEYHLNLLQNLATYTSIALDNANAYRQLNESEQEIGQRAAELSTVNSISRALASQLDVGELIILWVNRCTNFPGKYFIRRIA